MISLSFPSPPILQVCSCDIHERKRALLWSRKIKIQNCNDNNDVEIGRIKNGNGKELSHRQPAKGKYTTQHSFQLSPHPRHASSTYEYMAALMHEKVSSGQLLINIPKFELENEIQRERKEERNAEKEMK